ncbi:hypothetical protein [Paenibacillus campinasensis]|uniref:Uncharacterized protein n=1 Tax=Paenibacillus campinasensis TaxID=66347 RepID=A0A268EE18_9BACL|nr:hypothetical protein [Paenibacillus campinasensis]PAD71351.1 hypothetical protein CHH67_24715 [Paenibacillus campinasensis]
MKSMKKLSNRVFKITVTAALLSLFLITPAFAAGPGDPKLVSGSVELAKKIFLWMFAIIPITGGLMFGYHSWIKSMNPGDGGVAAERDKKMRNAIIYSAIAMGANGLVTYALYFLAPSSAG